jgi:hypothetical protein
MTWSRSVTTIAGLPAHPHCPILPFGGRPLAQAIVFALSSALGACTTAPLQDTKQFQQAFIAVDSVGQPLLDDLAIAERLQGQEIAKADAKRVTRNAQPTDGHKNCAKRWEAIDSTNGYIAGFCVSDTGFYSKVGDPPSTQAFRRAIALVGQFAQALTALADGTIASAATAQVQQLAQDASSLVASAGAASGVGIAIGPAAQEVFNALAPLINQTASAMSAEQERRVIVAAGPSVGDLITALKNASPALFDTLVQQTRNQIEHDDHPQASEALHIDAYRAALSDYVALLDQLNYAWNQLVVASQQKSNPGSLAILNQTSATIVADATAVRQSLAALRRGAAPN